MSATIRVGKMLRQVNDTLAAAPGAFAAVSANASFMDVIHGLVVELGTFPEVTISAGCVITPDGVSYVFEASDIQFEPAPNMQFYIFLNEDYNIQRSDELPVTARFLLARVTTGDTGEEFTALKTYGVSNIDTVDEDEQLIMSRLYSGPLCLQRSDYAYDTDGQPLTTIQQSTYRSLQLDYVYGDDGELESRKETHFPQHQFWLNGAVVLDDSEQLGGVVSPQVWFPHRYLIADGSVIADGSEYATGEF